MDFCFCFNTILCLVIMKEWGHVIKREEYWDWLLSRQPSVTHRVEENSWYRLVQVHHVVSTATGMVYWVLPSDWESTKYRSIYSIWILLSYLEADVDDNKNISMFWENNLNGIVFLDNHWRITPPFLSYFLSLFSCSCSEKCGSWRPSITPTLVRCNKMQQMHAWILLL